MKYVFLEHESKYGSGKFYTVGVRNDDGEVNNTYPSGGSPEKLRTHLSAILRDLYDEEIYRKVESWESVEYNVLDQFDAEAGFVADLLTGANSEATS